MRSALGEQAPSGAICYKVHYKAMALDHHVVEYDVDKAKRASLGWILRSSRRNLPRTLARHAPIYTLNRALGYRAHLIYGGFLALMDGIATDTQAIKIGVSFAAAFAFAVQWRWRKSFRTYIVMNLTLMLWCRV